MRFTACLALCVLASASVPTSELDQSKLSLPPTLVNEVAAAPPQAGFSLEQYLAVAKDAGTAIRSKVVAEWVTGLLGGLSYVAIMFLCAGAYAIWRKWPAPDPKSKEKDLSQWTSGPFDCFDDLPGFAIACCCSGIRLADSVSMFGITSFWVAFTLFCLLAVATSALPFLGCIALVVGIVWRQTFRARFDMPGRTEFTTYVTDGLMYICCIPCAIAQEARHLEEAAKAEHPAVREHRPLLEASAV